MRAYGIMLAAKLPHGARVGWPGYKVDGTDDQLAIAPTVGPMLRPGDGWLVYLRTGIPIGRPYPTSSAALDAAATAHQAARSAADAETYRELLEVAIGGIPPAGQRPPKRSTRRRRRSAPCPAPESAADSDAADAG